MEELTLPQRFEDFSEARRNGFIQVMEAKKNGALIAGAFCAYTPNEVLEAAGFITVGLCGISQETIPSAEKVLPRNLCPLIKSSYGFALTDQCPYFYFADIIVGETTCDGKKKMYELLPELGKNVYVMHLPQGADRDYEIDFWAMEIKRLIKYLEDNFDVEISDEKLREAVKITNMERKLRKEMFELQKLTPPPMWGKDMIVVSEGEAYKFNKKERFKAIAELTQQMKDEYDRGNRPVSKEAKRILLTGCPLGGAVDKIAGAIEDHGGVIVCYDTCGGTRSSGLFVDEEADDIIYAMADRYLKVGCSVLTPNKTRLDNLPQLLEDYKIDGVVEVILQACHTYNVESALIKKIVQDQDIPYILVETDYSQTDTGQVNTRVQAFIEML